MTFVAAAVGIAGIAGAAISANAAGDAADQQAAGARRAQDISQGEFNTITQQEQPFLSAGQGAQSQLNYLLGIGTPGVKPNNAGAPGTDASSMGGGYGSLLTPFTADFMKQYSPAYQFQLQQGQQGVLNGDTAGQGALSGAALKDLISFNQGQAGTAFNNAFNQYQTQTGNIYSRLAGISNLGQSAASQQAQSGTALAGQAAQSAQNIGTALAGGTVGAANAWSGALSNAATPWLLAGNNNNPYASDPYSYSLGGGGSVTSDAGYGGQP